MPQLGMTGKSTHKYVPMNVNEFKARSLFAREGGGPHLLSSGFTLGYTP